jgi:hypothetical protein
MGEAADHARWLPYGLGSTASTAGRRRLCVQCLICNGRGWKVTYKLSFVLGVQRGVTLAFWGYECPAYSHPQRHLAVVETQLT